jgi:hypothetical protein
MFCSSFGLNSRPEKEGSLFSATPSYQELAKCLARDVRAYPATQRIPNKDTRCLRAGPNGNHAEVSHFPSLSKEVIPSQKGGATSLLRDWRCGTVARLPLGNASVSWQTTSTRDSRDLVRSRMYSLPANEILSVLR